MSDDQQFMFRCLQKGSYEWEYTIAVISNSPDSAENKARTRDGVVLGSCSRKSSPFFVYISFLPARRSSQLYAHQSV
jgi:hypothetical protein